jgi:hypothetical protein
MGFDVDKLGSLLALLKPGPYTIDGGGELPYSDGVGDLYNADGECLYHSSAHDQSVVLYEKNVREAILALLNHSDELIAEIRELRAKCELSASEALVAQEHRSV